MFRRSSKRDKEKPRGHSNASDSEGESQKYGSLRRHSKLFSFGKKDKEKKKLEPKNNVESPLPHDADGIRVDESFDVKNKNGYQHHHPQTLNNGHSMTPVVEEKNTRKSSTNKSPGVSKHKRTTSTASRLSSTGSLSLDFGTDTSLMFQSFAADVLKATEEKLKGVDLKLPEIKPEPVKDSSRTIKLSRTKSGDYGFALRRSTIKKEQNEKIVHFVEPAGDEKLDLLPGDRLVSVDGVNVEDCDREEIIQKVATAGSTVTLKVVPVPEFSELSSRTAAIQKFSPKLAHKSSTSLARSGSLRTKMLKTSLSEKNLDKSWRETEKVWLLHQNGFSSGVLSKAKNLQDDSYAFKVTLDHGGEVIEDVEEDTVEKINPPQFDRVEDLSSLRYLNESGCLHTLRQRFASNLTHTHAGDKLIIIKPKQKLSVYTEKVMQMFQGCKREDMPPHIYATAQNAYRSMFSSNLNQSIVMLGHAGSGKSFNTQQLVHYVTRMCNSSNSNATDERMLAVISLLESFTHARTKLSCNASFCSFLYTFDFDSSGLVLGSNVQAYFLDKSRVSHVYDAESSYRIFYELLDGCSTEMKEDFLLDTLPKEGNILFDFENQFSTKETHSKKWTQLLKAFETLNISGEEMKGIIAPLVAILYLGAAGITAVPGMKPYFAQPIYAQRAASILGSTEENLARIIFTASMQLASRSRSSSTLSRTGSTASRTSINANKSDESIKTDVLLSPNPSLMSIDTMYDNTLTALEAFTAGIYVEAFTSLMRLVNRAVNSNGRVTSCINIFDSAGFQNKMLVSGADSLEDLRTNYCAEKLQWLMHYTTFTAQNDRYHRENIDINYNIDDVISPEKMIITLDKLTTERRQSHGDLKRSNTTEGKGLFWLIEEEAVKSNANDTSLVERIKTQHALAKGGLVTTNPNLPDIFVVSHLHNTVPIKYNVNGWLKRVREHPAVKMAYSVLSDSTKPYITELYAGHQSGTFHTDNSHHQHGRTRRKSQHAMSSVRRNSISMQYKTQMDRILEVLERTHIHFVYCLLPETTDGLLDPGAIAAETLDEIVPTFNIPFVRQQLRSSYLLESMRIHRQGYPDHVSYPEFRRRFGILLPKDKRPQDAVLDEKHTVHLMIQELDLEERTYKSGISQIFFRAGVLPQLEDTRDESIGDVITDFQALCRGSIARKNLKKRAIQKLALSCIQRNVRKFLLVRHWPWWRLYTKVSPLLDVHRTEQELKTKTGELTSLNNRISKLENEKDEKDSENARLKKKVQELSSQLSEIHSSATGAGELLDHETSERLRLEEELERAKMETERLSTQYKQLEGEYCDLKLNSISNGFHGNGYHDDGLEEELEENDNVWREKYKALSKELENTRRKLTEQSEEEIQELMNQKRISEKALAEERSETDEVRRQLNNNKRKLNKVNAELEDMKLLLDSLQGRNSELEKKQRKFDHDMQNLMAEVDDERTQRETAQRERDKYSSEKHHLANQLTEKDDEISQLKRKAERLQEEIDDFGTSGKSNDEAVTLKRQLREIETRAQDQEEELDEQAGQIQQLEQAKLKLEMASQRDKQQFQRDLDTKDEDIEQIRADHNRKMRAAEEQLDEEVKRREDANRAKRDIERRVFELESSAEDVDKGNERKLKKELKKLRILYKDAKKALESQQLKGGDQAEVKTLRNQLEDADFAKHMALKAKLQIEVDMEELTKQNDNLLAAKEATDERCLTLTRENGDLQTRIDEAEDEIEDVIRNNKQLITQLSEAQSTVLDIRERYRSLEDEKDALQQKVDHLTQKLDSSVKNMIERTEFDRVEFRHRELEAKFEADNSTRIKLEHQVNRLKGQLERAQDERTELQNNQSRLSQTSSRFERQAKEYRGELESIKRQEAEHKRRREEAETHVQNLEEDLSRKKLELTLAEKRIRELQESFEQDLDNSDDDTFLDDDESDDSFLSRRLSSSTTTRRLSSRMSKDSFDVSSSGYRSRRSFSGEDSYSTVNGSLSKDNTTRSATLGDQRSSTMSSRLASRTASRVMTRQSSVE